MANNAVFLSGSPLIGEVIATGIALPGHLIAGTAVHGTAGGNAQKVFADRMIGGDIDDAYAVGDSMPVGYPSSGESVSALVAAAAGAIAKGDPLESAGDGTLRKHTPQSVDEGGTATYNVIADAIVGYASEAVDNSAGSSVVRIKIKVA